MDLNDNFMKTLCDTARAYDAEKDPSRRAQLGERLDELGGMLGEGQVRQAVKMLHRMGL